MKRTANKYLAFCYSAILLIYASTIVMNYRYYRNNNQYLQNLKEQNYLIFLPLILIISYYIKKIFWNNLKLLRGNILDNLMINYHYSLLFVMSILTINMVYLSYPYFMNDI